MSRFPLHDLESAPDASRPLLQAAVKNNGYLSNLLAVLASAPNALEAYLTLSQLNAKGTLSFEEREVVQLIAATTHGCTFCVAGHSAIARGKVRMPEAQVTALRDGKTLENARLEQLAHFTRAVIAGRGRVDEPTLASFFEAGFTEASALEVVLGVSLATLCNFANNLGRPPLNPELSAHRWEGPAPT